MSVLQAAGFLLSAVASYAAFLYKLAQARRSWRDMGYVVLTVTLALQCLTFSMGVWSMLSDTLLGVRNLATLLLHLTAVAFCISAQVTLMLWANPLSAVRGRVRWWLVSGVVLIVVLTGLFVAADAPHLPREELAFGSTNGIILGYLLLFMFSQAVPCVTIFWQCVPYARATSKPWLRRGLRLLAVGAVVLFAYCVTRTVNILTALVGIDIGVWRLVPSLLSMIGIVVLSIALTMPSWGNYLSKAYAWGTDYLSYRALYPLWHSLYEASPDIALEPPSSSVSDLRYRLHRRVIEIRDGWRALRPYMDGVEHEDPAPEDDRVMLEAKKIKQALEIKRSGTDLDPSPAAGVFEDQDAKTFAAEVVWLKEVSIAYGRVCRQG